jgi:mannitol 2-dehydrogenase
MKLRLLNASHQAMAYLGYLAGYRYAHDVMDDPDFRSFIARLMDEEITPLLPPVPGIDLREYRRTLLERFANPKIKDTLARLATDGSDRMPKFVLPSVGEGAGPEATPSPADPGRGRFPALPARRRRGGPGHRHPGRPGRRAARAGERGPGRSAPVAGVQRVFGDLGRHEAWMAELAATLGELDVRGVRATLAASLRGE